MKKIELGKIGSYIGKSYKKGIKSIIIQKDTIIINIEKEEIKEIMNYLSKNSLLRFESLMDVWGVDYPGKRRRFEINYLLLSLKYNIRLILKVRVSDYEGVESVTSIYKSAGWLEREVWDMYGVYFANNKDLRRILTDYGFESFPLRKDFPLSGYTEVRYDDGEKRIVIEPLELSQEFRNFNFLSPWENSIVRK